MAPPAPQPDFIYFNSAASLEAPLGQPLAALEEVALACDSGEAYDRELLRVRRKLRLVAIPSRQLDAIQRAINELLSPVDFELGPEANGYVARRSTRTNALPHVGTSHLQKFDIKNFFDSITTPEVASALNSVGFGLRAAQLLGRLVTCEGRLPLGARTSPRASNLVLWGFDEAVSGVAATRGIAYTRYADDLTFSSPSPFDMRDVVLDQLQSRGFELNDAKSKQFKHGQPMFVTGLSVSDSRYPRVRARLKKRLRQELYFIQRFGLNAHAEAIQQEAGRVASRLTGQLFYVRSIEPEVAEQLERLYPRAYSELVPTRDLGRVERARLHREEFISSVRREPPLLLPTYQPFVSLR